MSPHSRVQCIMPWTKQMTLIQTGYLSIILSQLMNRKAHHSLMSYRLKNPALNKDKIHLHLLDQRKSSLNVLKEEQYKSPFRYDREKLAPQSSRTTLTYNQKNPYTTKLPKLPIKKDLNLEDTQKTEEKRILTVDLPRTKLLEPLFESCFIFSAKTKAGSSGKQTKTNQDIIFSSQKMALGMKGFVVCDGHGLYGHVVAAYIKSNLLKNINFLLNRKKQSETIVSILRNGFQMTNQGLLESEINTQYSGSTVVGCFIYERIIYCLNVGDSRAILANYDEKKKDRKWTIHQLSIDQKPTRPDERKRILDFGGRIEPQKDDKGNNIGPLRVWVAKEQLPGLAMTRSFGDKAGMRAGTMGDPEVITKQLVDSDKYMMMASDGVWQYLQNQDIIDLVAPYYFKSNIEGGCERIIQESSNLWSKFCLSRDDISCILIKLNKTW